MPSGLGQCGASPPLLPPRPWGVQASRRPPVRDTHVLTAASHQAAPEGNRTHLPPPPCSCVVHCAALPPLCVLQRLCHTVQAARVRPRPPRVPAASAAINAAPASQRSRWGRRPCCTARREHLAAPRQRRVCYTPAAEHSPLPQHHGRCGHPSADAAAAAEPRREGGREGRALARRRRKSKA